MPQMVIPDYAPQIVWLLLTFIALYFAMAKFALPTVERVLEERRSRIDANLERAAALKEEAEATAKAYEETLATARDEAQEVLRKAAEAFAEVTEKKAAAFDAELGEKTKAAESRITQLREKAKAETKSVATEVAAAIAARLIGSKLPENQVASAVEATLKEEI